jgi:hypothetical protein
MPLRDKESESRSEVLNLRDRETGFRDVDDAIIDRREDQNAQKTRSSSDKSPKLKRAAEISAKSTAEIKAMIAGLRQRRAEIGLRLQQADQYQGFGEKSFAFLGKLGFKSAAERADNMKDDRIQQMTIDDGVKEIERYTDECIIELGRSEEAFTFKRNELDSSINHALRTYREANPEYLKAKQLREKLQMDVDSLTEELKAGISEAERPDKERELDAVKRKLAGVQLDEVRYFEAVDKAQQALPPLQADRDAANEAIRMFHGMRQGMKENKDNYANLLKNAAVAMKARARLELFSSVDPALHKTIDAVLANDIATTGAAQEVYTERAKIAVIPPERMAELNKEFMDNVMETLGKLNAIEAETSKGSRVLAESAAKMARANGPDDPGKPE